MESFGTVASYGRWWETHQVLVRGLPGVGHGVLVSSCWEARGTVWWCGAPRLVQFGEMVARGWVGAKQD